MAGAAPEPVGASGKAASNAEPTPRSSPQGFYSSWKINFLSPLCSSEMGEKIMFAGKAERAACVLVTSPRLRLRRAKCDG